jgi:hypothetical protein
MNLKKLFIILSFLFTTTMVLGQGFSYTFTDPCTFKQKQIYIDNPSGSVLLSYNGSTQSFTQLQLQSGSLEQWINQVNSTNPDGPCSGVGLAQNTNMNVLITQNNIAVMTNVMSALNDISSIGGASVGGIVEAKEKSASENNKRKNNNSSNNNSTTNGQGSQTINNQNQGNGQTNEGNNGAAGATQTNQPNQTGGGTNPNGGGQTQGSGEASQTSGGNTGNPNTTTQGGGQQTGSTVGGNGSNPQGSGQSNNTQTPEETQQNQGADNARSSSSAKEKVANAKQGGIVLNGDIVVINSTTAGEKQQFKMNMSVVKSNTNNTVVKGALLNYTTSINNSSLTLFMGKKLKSFTGIVANSSMLNFERDLFNTTSLMTSYKYKAVTSTLGVNFTTGKLGDSRFQSLSALGGGVGTFKVSKKITNTTMMVVVYSPFVYYYEGLWYKSGWLLVPFTAFDYRLTQKFKLNLSFSGVQQIKSTTINYQVLLGAKALL